MKPYSVIVRGDRNRLWARYATQEQAIEAVAKLRLKGFDAWIPTGPSLPKPHIPVQLELQFD